MDQNRSQCLWQNSKKSPNWKKSQTKASSSAWTEKNKLKVG